MTGLHRAGFAILFAIVFAGCAQQPADTPKLHLVEGELLLDDQPLANAIIVFEPVGRGAASVGATDHRGRYRLRYSRSLNGAVTGEHVVRITLGTAESANEVMHRRYNSASQLREYVSTGGNVINFDLRSNFSY